MSIRTADYDSSRPAVVRPVTTETERLVLSLLLVDAGAFETAAEIAPVLALPVGKIKAALGRLLLLGFLDWELIVTDAGREALAEALG